MKPILLLCLCLSASAAPLPPALPPVIRPAPLLSPRAASVPKVTPMARASASITYPASPISITLPLRWNVNFFHCDTNDPNCVLYDYDSGKVLQRAGHVLRIELADRVPDHPRALLVTFGAGPTDRESGFDWLHPSSQRPRMRFFYEVQTLAPATLSSLPATPKIVVNPMFQGVHVWSTPKK